MKLKKICFILAALTLFGSFAGCKMPLANITGNQLADGKEKNMVIQSTVTMDESNINSMTGGKIKEIVVEEGQVVKKGDLLATLDSDALLAQKKSVEASIEAVKGQIAQAEAGKRAAEAKLAETKNGTRDEQLTIYKDAVDYAQANYDRVKALYDIGAETQAALDDADIKLKNAINQYELALNGATDDTIAAVQATVDQADGGVQAAKAQLKQVEASLEQININLNYTNLEAPADGVVTKINVKNGDLVSSGMPVAVVTQTEEPYIVCNLKETELTKVKMGNKVKIKLSSTKDKEYSGKIVQINKNADFAMKKATNDNGDFDVLSYGVKVQFDDMDKLQDILHAGMTAFVDFGK